MSPYSCLNLIVQYLFQTMNGAELKVESATPRREGSGGFRGGRGGGAQEELCHMP